MANVKLRYDATTKLAGKVYPENIIVPDPFLLITEEQSNKIAQDASILYFVVNNKLTTTQTQEYKDYLAKVNEDWFKDNFFEIASVGWIRKEFTMKDGRVKDFIFDAFPMITALITNNQVPANSFIFYTLPDFYQELTEEYLKTLNKPNALLTVPQTVDFVTTCKTQLASGFFVS